MAVSSHTVGIKKDGTVVAVGYNSHGQCNVSNWKDIVQISCGDSFTVGLKKDGTVVAVGNNTQGQCNIQDWTDIKQVSCGSEHTIGLKLDGTCIACGFNDDNQCSVDNWTNIVQIACGGWHTIGLKGNGVCISCGQDKHNQCNVDEWANIVQIACGAIHTIGLKRDSTCVAVGYNDNGHCNINDWSNIVQVTCGRNHTVGLKNNKTCIACGKNDKGQCNIQNWDNIICLMSESVLNIQFPQYLLKKNNQYYSIKSQFYDVNMCKYRPCEKDYETNGIDDLNDLTKNIDYIEIEKHKENVNDVDIFEFDLNNKIMNFDEEFERKIILKSNQIYSSTGIYANSNYYLYEHLINDTFDAGTPNYWLGKSKNGYLLISLENESYVEILKIYPYCRSDTYSHYSIAISSDNVNFEKVTEFTSEKKNEREFNIHYINKSIKYIKISFKTTGTWGDCLNEIQVYRPLVYCLLKKDNQHYTIKNNELTSLENQNLNKSNFETNGFDDLELLNNIDKTDVKLLVYDESNPDKLKLKYTLKEPFRPIDKFEGKIKILKQEMK